MPEDGGQDGVDASAGRWGTPRLLECAGEGCDLLGAYVPDGLVAEPGAHQFRAALVGEETADPCVRVESFRGEPDVDRLVHRLLVQPLEAPEVAFRFRAGLAGPRVDRLAAAFLTDQPLASACVPFGTWVAAPFTDRSHGGCLPHPTFTRQSEVEMPDAERDLGHRNDAHVQALSRNEQAVLSSSARQSPTVGHQDERSDAWHSPEWDDVFWWCVGEWGAA